MSDLRVMGPTDVSLAAGGEDSNGAGTLPAEPKPFERLGVRARAKQATRAKLLAAARELFSEVGYEKATIRDIAAAAGMSTGAVFANFTDKFDLFREIAAEDMGRLLKALADAGQSVSKVEDALLAVFTAGYRMYLDQLSLARAMLVVSWTEDQGAALRETMSVKPLFAIFENVLDAAVERGELKRDSDAKLRAEMLFETYLANYRQAVYDGWGLEPLQKRSREQIRIILAGARA